MHGQHTDAPNVVVKVIAGFSMTHNVEAMTSKGLRSDKLSTDTELNASYNVGLTTETFIGYRLC